jgi:type I restriction-modification system DNA methylase subunit
VRTSREIKEKFFQDLKKWRNVLRSHISKNYEKKYSVESIDLFTQKILDRLIFIDYCADNKILIQDRLHAILYSKDNLYKELKKIFSDMDEKFNSELFSKNECDELELADEVLRPIVIELSNIDFNRLSVHIIGEVYENYLGELLKSGKKGIKVEEEKATLKKKSQGIYYTPDYIVDYIVTNTVGKLLNKCKTIEEIEKIRVLDPACGSGSFLIRVFDEFLKHYERIDPKSMFQFETRKKILQNNIYGVDLDERAVEIAKLNLMIKALEGSASISLTGRKLLPNLKLNIRCGNSLISDKLSEEEMGLFWEEKNSYFDKLKPFNYFVSYPEIFEKGGFDCIVGNPPYTQLSMQSEASYLKEYLIKTYKSSMGRLNTFGFFISKSLSILKKGGLLGFIIPNTVLTQDYYRELRQIILDLSAIKSIVSFDNLPFKDAIVENIILHLERKELDSNKNNSVVNIYSIDTNLKFKKINSMPQMLLVSDSNLNFNISVDNHKMEIKNRISSDSKPLGDFLNINQGIALKHDRAKYLSKEKINSTYKPVLDGRNINQYSIEWDKTYLHYDLDAIHSGKNEEVYHSSEKLFFRRVGDHLVAALDVNNFYALNTLVVMNLKPDIRYDIKYFLASFNSELLNWYYKNFLKSTKKVFSEIQARQVARIPIKVINGEKNKKIYNDLILLVDEIMEAKASRNINEVKIQSIDQEINDLIFKLYGISRNEITNIKD